MVKLSLSDTACNVRQRKGWVRDMWAEFLWRTRKIDRRTERGKALTGDQRNYRMEIGALVDAHVQELKQTIQELNREVVRNAHKSS